MGTFLAIVFVSIGAVFVKSIMRDVQREQSRQAGSVERRRRAARTVGPQPAAAAPPAGAGGSESLVHDIGDAVVETPPYLGFGRADLDP